MRADMYRQYLQPALERENLQVSFDIFVSDSRHCYCAITLVGVEPRMAFFCSFCTGRQDASEQFKREQNNSFACRSCAARRR